MVGVEGTWTWLPTRDATVTSRAFGFTETGRRRHSCRAH